MGTPSRLSWPTSPNSSSDAPLFESRSAASSRSTMPRSPCSESTGWRNDAGVPVEVSVAAILRAISPDLPTPETMSRPGAAASSRTAAANGGPSRSATRRIAAASRARTRRPRSTRSMGSVRDIATLHEVLRQEVLPLAPRPEDQVREVVSHERTLFPGEPAPLAQRFEHGKLARARVLDHFVDRKLARALRRRGGLATAHPHDHEPCGLEQPDSQPVLDVEALELDGVVADHAEVDAVVGEDAVDVEADELQAAGEGSVDHRVAARGRGARLRWRPYFPAPPRRRTPPASCPPSSGRTWRAAPARRPPSSGVERDGPAGRRGRPRAADAGRLYGPTAERPRAQPFKGLRTDRLPRPLPDFERHAHNRRQLVERQHVRPVGRSAVGVGVRLEEEPVRTGGGGGVQERRDEFPQAAARAAPAPAPLLYRGRGVGEDRDAAGRPQTGGGPPVPPPIA